MSIKNINIEKKENVIKVHVELNERNDKKGYPKTRFDTSNILQILKEKSVSHGEVIQEYILKNWHPDLLAGIWIFEKKAVDKPKKQVILKEEKPKTTRQRRTKKASTEE